MKPIRLARFLTVPQRWSLGPLLSVLSLLPLLSPVAPAASEPSPGPDVTARRLAETAADYPIDFTPNAPALLIGSPYTSDPAYTERAYQGVPTCARTGSRYWAACRGDITVDGKVAEKTGNFVTLFYSDDGCATWREYGYIRYKDDLTRGVYDPFMWTDPDGRLWVMVVVNGGGVVTDGVFGSYVFTCKNPASAIPHWSTPWRLSRTGFPSQPVLIDEQVFIPINYWFPLLTHKPAYPELVGKRWYRLHYRERRIEYITTLPKGTKTSFDETIMAQLPNGDVRAIWRTGNSPYSQETSLSKDAGKTWSAPASYTALGTNVSSRAWLGTSPSGRLIAVYNHDKSRKKMTIKASEDGGESWPCAIELEEGTSSYPWVMFGPGEEIFVVFDQGRTNPGFRRVMCARVLESDLLANRQKCVKTTISDKGYLK